MARNRDFSSIGDALSDLTGEMQPQTSIARIQSAWPEAVGETVARWAVPVSERGGLVTFACTDSMVAHELEMMKPELLKKLEKTLDGQPVSDLRFTIR
ncbi:MAG: DUF721 domain-containing protein [Solirubrobacterales bacterium]